MCEWDYGLVDLVNFKKEFGLVELSLLECWKYLQPLLKNFYRLPNVAHLFEIDGYVQVYVRVVAWVNRYALVQVHYAGLVLPDIKQAGS